MTMTLGYCDVTINNTMTDRQRVRQRDDSDSNSAEWGRADITAA